MRPFPDTAAALEAVKRGGYKLGRRQQHRSVRRQRARRRADRAGIRDSFDVVLTSVSVGERKPGPAIYRRALQLLGCEASEAIMVGDDARVDLVGGAALGMPTVLVVRPGSKGPSTTCRRRSGHVVGRAAGDLDRLSEGHAEDTRNEQAR